MQSNQRISELLLETGAYRDLDKPVILTSGELGIYYINTEKLVQDDGAFERYGDNSHAMIDHAIQMMEQHPTFGEVVDILAGKVRDLFPERQPGCTFAVSGGQRRDWLFSGPVAKRLDIPHLSLYKDGAIDIIFPNGTKGEIDRLDLFYVVHLVDLITEGSSVYRVEDLEREKGWVPMIRGRKGKIKDLVAVVTRLQGGEEMLAQQGVMVHPFVAIDEDFLRRYSKDPERALAYHTSPKNWSDNYLRRDGALALVGTFDPKGNKLDRARKFLTRYANFLVEAGRDRELDDAVQEKYSTTLKQIMEGGIK